MNERGRFSLGVILTVLGLAGVALYAFPSRMRAIDAPQPAATDKTPTIETAPIRAPAVVSTVEPALERSLNNLADGIVTYANRGLPPKGQFSRTVVIKVKSELVRQPNKDTLLAGVVLIGFAYKDGQVQGVMKMNFGLVRQPDGSQSWVIGDIEPGKYDADEEIWLNSHKALLQLAYTNYVNSGSKDKNASTGMAFTSSVNSETFAEWERSRPAKSDVPPPAPTYVPSSVGFRLSNQTVSKEHFNKLAAGIKPALTAALLQAEPKFVREDADFYKIQAVAVMKGFVDSAMVSRQLHAHSEAARGPDDCVMALSGTGRYRRIELMLDLQFHDDSWTVLRVLDGGQEAESFITDLCKEAVEGISQKRQP